MINTLAIFMPNEKIRLSCYAIQDIAMLSPYMILQGFVTVIFYFFIPKNFFILKIGKRKIRKNSIQFWKLIFYLRETILLPLLTLVIKLYVEHVLVKNLCK